MSRSLRTTLRPSTSPATTASDRPRPAEARRQRQHDGEVHERLQRQPHERRGLDLLEPVGRGEREDHHERGQHGERPRAHAAPSRTAAMRGRGSVEPPARLLRSSDQQGATRQGTRKTLLRFTRGRVRWSMRERRHWRSGCASRAPARSGLCTLAPPGPDEVAVRTLRSAVSRGTESLVFGGRVPAEPVRRDAGALPGRRLPRAGEVRLPQRGRRGGRPSPLARAHRLLPAPPPDGVRRARRPRSPSCRTTCPCERAVLAGIVETAVNALWDAGPLVGDRVAVVGAGMVGLLRRPAARADPRRLRHAGRRRPARAPPWPPPSGWTSPCP